MATLGAAMVECCTHCGADLSHRPPGGVFGVWPENCPDCGLVQADDVPTLAPGDNQIEFAVAEWEPGDRILLRNALTDRGVLWRWQPGPVMVVDERARPAVQAVLDDLDQQSRDERAGRRRRRVRRGGRREPSGPPGDG